MNSNLWDTTETDSDSTPEATAAASTTNEAEQSPLTAAIEASNWSRADVELALQLVQAMLLAVWLYTTLTDD